MNQPTSKRLTKLDHTIPINSPRTTYRQILQNDENLLADLTLNFDPFTINVLKNEFYIRGWQMDVTEFILVVKEHLLSWQVDIPNREIKLIRQLANLFQEIDLNGNGILEWEEFTNYIIEKATVLNNIKSKQDEIKLYTKSHMKPDRKFLQMITKVIYIKDIDKIAFFEDGSDEVQFITPEGALGAKPLKIIPISETVESSTVKKDKLQNGQCSTFKIEYKEIPIPKRTKLLSILYIDDPKYQVLLTSTHDGYVRGWRYQSSQFILANQPDNDEEMIEHHFQNDIYSMAWDGIGEILYCGTKEGVIHIWNLKTDTETMLPVDGGHNDVVMDMIAMPKLQFMASAALDGNLILWNTLYNKRERTYKEHTRGIVSLAFNESLILLFSAGFDHNLCVWNPYIESLIFKIQGHSSPLVGVLVVESQIVSMDQEGLVKVWDTKKFNCVQQFSVETQDEKHKFNPQSMCYVTKPLKLIFSGRTIYSYDYDKNYNPNSVDDYVALGCKLIENQMAFFTPAGTKIKVWNSLTGDVKKIYSDITTTEITAFKTDHLEKRFIIGDSSGQTALFNVINGAKIKHLPKHNGEIVALLHAFDIGAFFTGAMDNQVQMSLDNEFGESELLRVFTIIDSQLTTLSYDPSMKHLLAGTNNGQVRFYETDTNKLHGVAGEPHVQEEVTSLNLIPGIPFLIMANSQGRISVLSMPPILHRFVKIYTFSNIDPEFPTSVIGVSNAILCPIKQLLYVADDKGYLRCFDVSWIIDLLTNIVAEKDREDAATKKMKGIKSGSNQQARQMITLPKIPQKETPLKWCIRAHYEVIKSLEYVFKETLLITTSFDKKVKIWDSETGRLVDSFQQNYDRKEPRPIAFKRAGTDEIYNPDLSERVDFNTEGGSTQQSTFNKTPDEEFNPFHYIDKIDQSKLTYLRSNPEWKLEVHFKEYYLNYERNIKALLQQVQLKERDVYDKQVKQGIHNRHFKVQNYQAEGAKIEEDIKKPEQMLAKYKNKQIDSAQVQNSNAKLNFDSLANQGEIYKEIKQQDKDLNDNFKHSIRQQAPTPNKVIAQPVAKMQKQSQSQSQKKIVRKADPAAFDRLYRQSLKSKILFQAEPDVYLSEVECNAAYRLAAALANYDLNDERSLKFAEVRPKNSIKLPRIQ